MKLSLEIPLPHIEEFLPLTDFPFLLAHLVLDKKYPETKHALLDNSMYELDESLEIPDLIEAVKRCKPVSVIAPDWMDDMDRTLSASFQLREALHKARDDEDWPYEEDEFPDIGAVVQGKDLAERVQCMSLMSAQKFWPVCLPFRTPRIETILEFHRGRGLDPTRWYHLLGMQDLQDCSLALPGYWSIDTAKPFKGFKLAEKEIRGHGKLDIEKRLTIVQRSTASWNIAYLRKLMADVSGV